MRHNIALKQCNTLVEIKSSSGGGEGHHPSDTTILRIVKMKAKISDQSCEAHFRRSKCPLHNGHTLCRFYSHPNIMAYTSMQSCDSTSQPMLVWVPHPGIHHPVAVSMFGTSMATTMAGVAQMTEVRPQVPKVQRLTSAVQRMAVAGPPKMQWKNRMSTNESPSSAVIPFQSIWHRNACGHPAVQYLSPVGKHQQYTKVSHETAFNVGAAATAEVPVMMAAAHKSARKVADYLTSRWPSGSTNSPATKKQFDVIASRSAMLLEATLRAELKRQGNTMSAWDKTPYADAVSCLQTATYLHALSRALPELHVILLRKHKKDNQGVLLATKAVAGKLMPRFRSSRGGSSTPPRSPIPCAPQSPDTRDTHNE